MLEVDGVEVVSSSPTEIESWPCGPVETSVTIKTSSAYATRHPTVLERGCEGDLHSESAVQRLAERGVDGRPVRNTSLRLFLLQCFWLTL